jgi:hypothetical protein
MTPSSMRMRIRPIGTPSSQRRIGTILASPSFEFDAAL